jgi:hypothetical protein
MKLAFIGNIGGEATKSTYIQLYGVSGCIDCTYPSTYKEATAN